MTSRIVNTQTKDRRGMHGGVGGGGGGEGICFGADCQMWKSPGVGTRVLEIGLRSNFRFQPDYCAD